MSLKNVFHDLFTGRNNRTYDIGRVLWFQGCQAYLLFTGYSLYKVGGTFDPIAWGGGLAALLGAGGAALGLKSNTEPEKDEDGDGIPDVFQKLAQTKATVTTATVETTAAETSPDSKS